MNREAALKVMGLDDSATAEDIKAAYKQMAQILHPDRFEGNKKLQDKATEQFKTLQEAYDLLSSGKSGRTGTQQGTQAHSAADNRAAQVAGIIAARTQLVAQRDHAKDERHNGIIMAVVGAVAVLLTLRRPYGVFGLIAAIGSAACVWGIIQVVSAHRTITTLDAHILKLKEEQKRLEDDAS